MILPFIPKNIQIEISNRCNLKCPLCPCGQKKALREIEDIEFDYFKDIMKELEKYDTKIQLWNYGEPLLHKQIIPLLKSIPKKFSECSISTNGHFMSKEYAEAITSSGITEVIFAIDGITQETYSKYRIGGSLAIVLENLKIFNELNYNRDIKVTIQFIAFKHNLHEIPLLGNFFKSFSVNEIKVKSAMLMTTDENNDLEIAKKYLSFNYDGERYKIDNLKIVPKGNFLNYCPLVENSLVITTDKKILPCCWDYEGLYQIKNEKNWISIKNLINSENYPKMCNKCPIRYGHIFSWDWDKVPGIIY
ncbi:radical SAM protein [bacterium]|nr:radical SAM protein [bacterium]